MTELLSTEELSRVEQGLPRLSEWGGADMLVPFPVRQLRHASVLWLNRRWFLERGIDVTDAEVLSRVSAWLVETFGYIILETEHKPSIFTSNTKIAHADRYGSSSGLAQHGGSGRVAVYGCFQAKGVGATPLVGMDVSPDHSNGCVSLGEAIREAIYSEIMDAEFPYGAVPVISILDTGLHYFAPEPGANGIQKVRRAIVIRPSVLRPAHAERAPLFKRSITGDMNAQEGDVNRTQTVVRNWLRQGRDGKTQTLQETLGRVAEQAAFGQVHRLFSGGFFSSNLSVTGELHDFGNAYALPDWVNAKVLAHTSGFGRELEAVDVLAKSMDFYFRKYDDAGLYQGSSEALIDHAKRRYREAFARECLRTWQAEDLAGTESGNQIVGLLSAFFRMQQRASRRYDWYGKAVGIQGRETEGRWLYDALIAMREGTGGGEQVATIIEQIDKWLRRGFESTPESRMWICWLTAYRLLRPRHDIDRGLMLRRIKDLTSQLSFPRQDCAEQITSLIRTSVHHGRAQWPRLPLGYGVLAQVTCDGCTALLCSQGPDAPRRWWLEGISLGGHIYLFGSWVLLDEKELEDFDAKVSGPYCSFFVPESGTKKGKYSLLRVGRHQIKIPEMSSCVPWDTENV